MAARFSSKGRRCALRHGLEGEPKVVAARRVGWPFGIRPRVACVSWNAAGTFHRAAMKRAETTARVEESRYMSDAPQTLSGARSPARNAPVGTRQLSFQSALFLLLGGAVI